MNVPNGSTASPRPGTAPSLADYDSTVECDYHSGTGTAIVAADSFSSRPTATQVTCTITNARKAQVKVVKQLTPSTDAGKFDLKINATTSTNSGAGFGDSGTTGFVNVPNGSTSVSELGHGTTSLADYDSPGQLRLGQGLGRSGHASHTFSVGYGDKVTCTITN